MKTNCVVGVDDFLSEDMQQFLMDKGCKNLYKMAKGYVYFTDNGYSVLDLLEDLSKKYPDNITIKNAIMDYYNGY